MSQARKPYRPKGLLALAPKALGEEFPEHAHQGHALERDGVAIVPVSGPLSHRIGGGLLSYHEIVDAVRCAAASSAHTILLRIDSPGGDVAGVLDASREIRKVAREAGKRLVAFSDSLVASAAYAVACAADEIVISATACAGSIGVIEALVDVTAADAAQGIQWTLVTSGALKGTGNPHATLSDEGRAEVQQHVDDMAAEFFAWVREARGFDPQPLEAAVFVGRRAVTAQVADRVLPWDLLLEELKRAPQGDAEAGATSAGAMLKASDSADEARKYLKKMADSEDADEAKKAKRALEALDADDSDGDGDGDKDEKKAEDDADEKKAEDEGEEKKAEAGKKADAEDAEDEAEARATSSLAAQVHAANQKIAALEEANAKAERNAIFAARPDLSPDLVKTLSDLPVSRVKAIVATIPKGKAAARAAQDSAGSQLPGPTQPSDELSIRMGLVKPVHNGVTLDGNRMTLGAPVLDPQAMQALDSAKGSR